MTTIFNSIISSFVLIAESIAYIFTGIKPHLYKEYRSDLYNEIVEKYSIPEKELSHDEKELSHDETVVYNQRNRDEDWEKLGEDFEPILGIYPGSPTWKRMATGKMPKTEEFDRMYKRYEEDVTDRILERVKNDPAYKDLMNNSSRGKEDLNESG